MAEAWPPWRQRLEGLGFGTEDKSILIRRLLAMAREDREVAMDINAKVAAATLRGMLSDAAVFKDRIEHMDHQQRKTGLLSLLSPLATAEELTLARMLDELPEGDFVFRVDYAGKDILLEALRQKRNASTGCCMASNLASGDAGPAAAPSSSAALTSFSAADDLRRFLQSLDPPYPQYTDTLWAFGVRSLRELASAETLRQAGVNNNLHIDNIKASAGAALSSGQAGAGAGAGASAAEAGGKGGNAGAEPTYHNITFCFEDEQGELDKFSFTRNIRRSRLIALLQERGLFAICDPDEQVHDEEGIMNPCSLEDAEFEDNTTYFAVLKGSTQTFGAFLRSLMDADEHQMGERLLKRLQKDNPRAYRICQKHFWSMDKTIKFECDVLVVDGDNIYLGEGKNRLGPRALTDIDTKMAKIKQLVGMDGDEGHASFFYNKTIIPFLFGRTWISSGIGKDDRNRKNLEASLDALMQGAEERGAFVLFPDGCFQSCFPGHQSGMPFSASRVCRVASASQHTPAATAITGLGPPCAMRMQVRQPPLRFRRPLAPGYMPRGRIGCSGFRRPTHRH